MSSRMLSLFFVGSLIACSSSGTAPATTDSGSNASGDAGDSGTTPSLPCSEPMDEWPAGSQCVRHVTGKVVDTNGVPVAGKTVSVCGNICFSTQSAADGTYTVVVDSHIVLADFAASVHGRPEFASLLVKLPASTVENIALPDMVVPKLPATGTKISFDTDTGVMKDATTVVSGDVTLSFQAGTDVSLDIEDATSDTGNQLRVAKVEPKDYPPFAKEAHVTALYAINPFGSTYDKKVAITIANTSLADGPVEFVILGDQYVATPVTAGAPVVVATGTASDGTVTTDAGQGTNVITWIGIRPKL